MCITERLKKALFILSLTHIACFLKRFVLAVSLNIFIFLVLSSIFTLSRSLKFIFRLNFICLHQTNISEGVTLSSKSFSLILKLCVAGEIDSFSFGSVR